MNALQPFFDAPLMVQLHAISAIEALVLGAYVLHARKGGRLHRVLGYLFTANMAVAIATSWFITGLQMIGPFSPIHALSAYATVTLTRAILAARRGDIPAHRGEMRGLYYGGICTAGVLAFLPGRVMNRIFFAELGEEQGFMLVLALAMIGVGIYLRRRLDPRGAVYALPMSTPAAKTSAPPKTTWKAARKKGVSM